VASAAGNDEPFHDAIIASARVGEPDRYLAALLAPAAARGELLTLAAFSAELARIPYAASREPAMAEVRLQWWRDALALPQGAATGNPIADRLRALGRRHGAAAGTLSGLIEARALELGALPFADDAALASYLAGSEAGLFALSARIIAAAGNGPAADWDPGAAGQAYGLARLLYALPASLARGQLPVPQTRLAAWGLGAEVALAGQNPAALAGAVAELAQEARQNLALARREVTKLPRDQSIAVLPLALVESYLRTSARAVGAGRQAEVAPLTRVLRIARARWFGRW
jgi:15-cis-phytoene synthase